MWETLRECHGKATPCWFPITDGHRPLLRDSAHRQIHHFVDRFIRRKDPMIPCDECRSVILTDGSGIGGVDHGCRMSSGKAKSGITCGKSGSPRPGSIVGSWPSYFEGFQFQIAFGFRLGTGRIDCFEVGCHRCACAYEKRSAANAHQMHHAHLHTALADRPSLWLLVSRTYHRHTQ
jgi:hypothetical protein